MLCEKCKKREATTFLKQSINGSETTYNLCAECASKFYYKGLNDFSIDFSNLLGLALSQNDDNMLYNKPTEEVDKCPECAMTFKDIVNLGKVGCGRCYITFQNQLMPSIQRIHGKTEHVGKVSVNAGEKIKKSHMLHQLKEELSDAIKEQNFEHAAILRDKIRDIEKERE